MQEWSARREYLPITAEEPKGGHIIGVSVYSDQDTSSCIVND